MIGDTKFEILDLLKHRYKDLIATKEELTAIEYLKMQEGYEFDIKSRKEILEECKKEHNQKTFFARIFDGYGRRMIKIYEEDLKKAEAEKPTLPNNFDVENARKSRNNLFDRLSALEYACSFKEISEATGADFRTLLEQDDFILTPIDRDKNHKITTEWHSGRHYSDINELVLVHKTNYLPNGDKIINTRNSSVPSIRTLTLRKETIYYQVKNFRNTIHFCLNGEVSTHGLGNWSATKYAVVQPVTKKIAVKIAVMNCADTFVDGNLDLDGAYILCPIEEKDEAKKRNPNSVIVGYKGDTVDKYADLLVTLLGYQNEKIGVWSWANDNGNERISEIIKQYNYETANHTFTIEKQRDDRLEKQHSITDIIKKCKEKVVSGEISIMELYEERFLDGNFYGVGLEELNTKLCSETCTEGQSVIQQSLEHVGIVDSSSKIQQIWKDVITEDLISIIGPSGYFEVSSMLRKIMPKLVFAKNMINDGMEGLDINAFEKSAKEYIKASQEKRGIYSGDESSKGM